MSNRAEREVEQVLEVQTQRFVSREDFALFLLLVLKLGHHFFTCRIAHSCISHIL